MPKNLLILPLAAALVLAGCTDNNAPATAGSGDGANQGSITGTVKDDGCTVSAAEAPSGRISFTIKNEGTKVNEFELLRSDGLAIVGEVENIGPGATRDLVLQASPGSYYTACKPGMVGTPIKTAFTVKDSGRTVDEGSDRQAVEQANKNYQSYVKDQVSELLAQTKAFAAAYTSKQDDKARSLYPVARQGYERVETVAESFGDLDPELDERFGDVKADLSDWTGWHRIELDLWPKGKTPEQQHYTPLDDAGRKKLADKLVADTQTLHQKVQQLNYTTDTIANGAQGLLDEVANSKITGEEDAYSHTDLWDFAGNVDGARVAWTGLRPILKHKDPALDKRLETKFAALQQLLDQHKQGAGYKPYTELDQTQVKQLSDAVNALAEPLSKLASAVV